MTSGCRGGGRCNRGPFTKPCVPRYAGTHGRRRRKLCREWGREGEFDIDTAVITAWSGCLRNSSVAAVPDRRRRRGPGHCELEQSEGDFRGFASAIHQVACDV